MTYHYSVVSLIELQLNQYSLHENKMIKQVDL